MQYDEETVPLTTYELLSVSKKVVTLLLNLAFHIRLTTRVIEQRLHERVFDRMLHEENNLKTVLVKDHSIEEGDSVSAFNFRISDNESTCSLTVVDIPLMVCTPGNDIVCSPGGRLRYQDEST